MEEIEHFKDDKQADLARVKEPQAERSVSPAGEHVMKGPDATDRRVRMLCSRELSVYFCGRFLNSKCVMLNHANHKKKCCMRNYIV